MARTDFEKAFNVGRVRCAMAVAFLKGSTGLKAEEMFAVRPVGKTTLTYHDNRQPVGRKSFKDIAVILNRGEKNTLLGVVDSRGVFKACLVEFLTIEKALELAGKVPLRVARTPRSTLRKLLAEKDPIKKARATTLDMDALEVI